MRRLAIVVLVAIYLAALAGPIWSGRSYARQERMRLDERPTLDYPLGTDDLGRDRLGRLLTATAISLSLAPAGAALAVCLASVAGAGAGMLGGALRKVVMAGADLTLCVPTLFLLLLVRAALPLDIPPMASLLAVFGLLGTLGWAGPARVVCAATGEIMAAPYITMARARGLAGVWILARHVMPNLRQLVTAQFLTLIPVFLLAEANLSMLGLGVTDPSPSLGGLLKELQSVAALGGGLSARPWLLAPVAVLGLAASCAFLVSSRGGER